MATAWTTGRLKAFVVAALRSATRRYPPKYETLKEAATEKKVNVKTGRVAQHYQCNLCKEDFPAKEINIDHILPAVDPATGFTTWDEFIERLFCPKENLQAVCVPCHKIKTLSEKQLSKLAKPLKLPKEKSSSKAPSTKKK